MTKKLEWVPEDSVACKRCGMKVAKETIKTRQKAGNTDVNCRECTRKPATLIKNADKSICMPWQGDIDLDTMQPLKNGRPWMIGPRSCGKSDCMNSKHLKKSAATTIGILHGKAITYEELILINNRRENKK